MKLGLTSLAVPCLMTLLLTACGGGGGGGGVKHHAPGPDIWKEYGTEIEVALRTIAINDDYFGYNRARYVGGKGYVYSYLGCPSSTTTCTITPDSGISWGLISLHGHFLLTAEGLLDSKNFIDGFAGTITFDGSGKAGFYYYNTNGISTPPMETISAELRDVGGKGVLAFLRENKAALAGTDFVDELSDLTALDGIAALEDNVFDSRAKAYLETHTLNADYGFFDKLDPLTAAPEGYTATTLHGQTVYVKSGSPISYLLKDDKFHAGTIYKAGTRRVLTWNDYAAPDIRTLIGELRSLP